MGPFHPGQTDHVTAEMVASLDMRVNQLADDYASAANGVRT